MSEISDLVAAVDKVRLGQSRAIAKIIDRRAKLAADGDATSVEDIGYEDGLAILAVVLGKAPTEIEELGGTMSDLGAGVAAVLQLAGYRLGEPEPVAPSNEDSATSTAPSPPAAATPTRKSTK